ncbi:hypothetical protein Tco_1379201 [Tanacetum coccineum]
MLWDYLSHVIANWKGEMIIIGDFNEVRNKAERFGVTPPDGYRNHPNSEKVVGVRGCYAAAAVGCCRGGSDDGDGGVEAAGDARRDGDGEVWWYAVGVVEMKMKVMAARGGDGVAVAGVAVEGDGVTRELYHFIFLSSAWFQFSGKTKNVVRMSYYIKLP